jgi:hypothetical protein
MGRATDIARKPPDVLSEEGQWNARSIELPLRDDEVIDGEYEGCSDAKMREVRRKGEALESLALYGQVVEIFMVEIVNHQEQQLIWKVEEGHRLSLMLVRATR